MEPLSILPVTLASVMATFSTDNANVEQAVITTHVSPEIAGVWELDLQAIPDFAKPDAQNKAGGVSVDASESQELQDLIAAIQEANRVDQDIIDHAKQVQASQENSQAQADNNQTNNRQKSSTGLTQYDPEAKSLPIQPATVAASNQCRERYSFGADNVLVTTSGEEWTYSNYMYQHQDEGLPIIAITTRYDNNKPDCSGTQVDQAGEALLAFVDYQPKNNLMRWCIDPKGTNCFMTFHKLVP
ncbi:hypothetical protein [Psychrobacter sp. FDAARGOS_221]|uniref:hypothetical protein n=1 Tax=Psychrobacter sp. FDAARGOS_221 TaxID=1975705 RepID=UPI000BB54063|nr:hypothetical protein [Psychrobacter sp. FDAARGOS_221]PNK59878.1 hypothetical protein A6J60_002625 [Psychrobacter sp. FDAARGOS_221]